MRKQIYQTTAIATIIGHQWYNNAKQKKHLFSLNEISYWLTNFEMFFFCGASALIFVNCAKHWHNDNIDVERRRRRKICCISIFRHFDVFIYQICISCVTIMCT